MATLWHYNGTPEFLHRQADRLRSTHHLAGIAIHNKEVHRISVILNQLCERYHKARKEDGEPVFGAVELVGIRDSFRMCEQELEKLHILAGAADEMLEQAYGAMNIDAPARPFVILAESDDATLVDHSNGESIAVEAESIVLP